MALALVAGAIAYPAATNQVIDIVNQSFGSRFSHVSKNFVLGLDLQGGTRLEYEADVARIAENERRGALDGVRDVIERRVNSIGLSEPLIQTARVADAWRVSVELAGIRDVNQAITLIGETPILEFKEQDTSPPRGLTPEETKQMNEKNVAAAQAAEADLTKMWNDPTFGQDRGFLKDKLEYADLFRLLAQEKVGALPRVIETDRAFFAARIQEEKAAGTEVNAAHILIQYAGAEQAPSGTIRTKAEARAIIERIAEQATSKNFVNLAKKYSEEPGAKASGGDIGWFSKGMMVSEFEAPAFEMKIGTVSRIVETPFGFHLISKYNERPLRDVHVRLIAHAKTQPSDILPASNGWKNTSLTGKQLKRSQIDFDSRSGAVQVSLIFDDEGTKLFADITKRSIGKPVAIFLDGQILSQPTVQSMIPDGQAVITGSFSIPEAKLLAQRLQAGALPVPIKLIAQQSVGPTLGQDSVHASLIAGIWGFAFVALFMLAWYRLPGLLAIVSLVLYVAISFAIFKTLPVTLTLSGIAGFILSLGIALDANVLIFERLKEELRAGKAYGFALEEAFRRAWPSIRDGNTTTLISCAVLYWFSSSVIKGFALTLAIGVLMSLFTAIVVTRTTLRLVATPRIVEALGWMFLRKQITEKREQI